MNTVSESLSVIQSWLLQRSPNGEIVKSSADGYDWQTQFMEDDLGDFLNALPNA